MVANRLLRLAYALVREQTFYQIPKLKVAPELELVAAILGGDKMHQVGGVTPRGFLGNSFE